MNRQGTTHAPQQAVTTTSNASGTLQRKCACGTHTVAGGECASCGKEKSPANLQRAATNAEPDNEVPPIVHEVLGSSGQTLDASARAFFEPRFGHDFSQVRIHTDAKPAESAQAVNALAYTVGNKMVFGREAYLPHTFEGKGLVAHELTHVVQQREGVGRIDGHLTVGKLDTIYERNAHAVAERIVSENHSS